MEEESRCKPIIIITKHLQLVCQGKKYVLVVDSVNATAVADPKIFNHLIQNKFECFMEVNPIALRNSMMNSWPRVFQLADIIQNPAKKYGRKFKFIDTRNFWVNLKAIKMLIETDALKIENLSGSKVLLVYIYYGSLIIHNKELTKPVSFRKVNRDKIDLQETTVQQYGAK